MRNVEVVNGQGRALTAAEFCKLADIPPEIEWFANLRNPHTRAAYEHDLREFQQFVGMTRPEEFRTVTRAHVIAWRKDLERRLCAPTTIQRKLAALSSLFTYLCEHNAVLHNPVNGVKRPKSNRQEGTTPALSDEQARALLGAPQGDSLKAKRDRAILATLAYHGMRREELCKLRVRDLQRRDGVLQFRIEGKGEKVRYVPVGMKALRLITEYLEAAGHKEELEGPLIELCERVAARAGVSAATVRKLFPRRESLLAAGLDHVIALAPPRSIYPPITPLLRHFDVVELRSFYPDLELVLAVQSGRHPFEIHQPAMKVA